MPDDAWYDGSILEAVSWRLASELVRRHPDTLRLIRGHPAGGQSDVLWITALDDGPGDLRLNRAGTIQVLARFDGSADLQLEPVQWETYIRADPRQFLARLEAAAGLPIRARVPAARPTTLTYRVLAALASMAIKTVHPISIQQGFIDTSGYGGGPNETLSAFEIPQELLRTRPDDFYSEPGYRFWIVHLDDAPILAIEQRAALAWVPHRAQAISLMDLYARANRSVLVAVGELLRAGDQVQF